MATEVQTIIDNMVAKQDETFNRLQELITSVRETASESLSVEFPEFETLHQYDPYLQMQAAESALKSLVDNPPSVTFVTPEAPGAVPNPTIEGVELLEDVTIPAFTKAPPTLSFPSDPVITTPAAPQAPVVSQPTLPEAPTYSLPAAPSLTEITLPSPPSIELPSFAAVAPAFDLAPPSNSFAFQEVGYSSDLLDQLTADILSDLQNGGYGIHTADETGIWNRAREREEAQARQEEEQVVSDFAARGFPSPPGAMQGALGRMRQKLREAANSLSRETAVKRYDQMFEARKAALGLGLQVETALIAYHGQKMERALNFARSVAEVSISIYNAALATFNAKLDAYKTEAQAFETLLRAQVERVNLYRAQLEGERAKGEIDRNRVQLYTAQLDGIKTMVSVYTERMNAARVFSEIEQLKLQAFKANVDAYTAQINAGESTVRLYEAKIRGQVAKVDSFKAEVAAHEAQVRGKEAEVRAISELVRASTEVARSKFDAFRAEVDAFRALTAAEGDRVGAEARIFEAKTRGVDAYARTMKEIGESYVRKNQWDMADRFKRLESQVEKAKLDYNQLFQNRGIRIDTGKWEAEVWKEIAGSALASLDAVVAKTTEE